MIPLPFEWKQKVQITEEAKKEKAQTKQQYCNSTDHFIKHTQRKQQHHHHYHIQYISPIEDYNQDLEVEVFIRVIGFISGQVFWVGSKSGVVFALVFRNCRSIFMSGQIGFGYIVGCLSGLFWTPLSGREGRRQLIPIKESTAKENNTIIFFFFFEKTSCIMYGLWGYFISKPY